MARCRLAKELHVSGIVPGKFSILPDRVVLTDCCDSYDHGVRMSDMLRLVVLKSEAPLDFSARQAKAYRTLNSDWCCNLAMRLVADKVQVLIVYGEQTLQAP